MRGDRGEALRRRAEDVRDRLKIAGVRKVEKMNGNLI